MLIEREGEVKEIGKICYYVSQTFQYGIKNCITTLRAMIKGQNYSPTMKYS